MHTILFARTAMNSAWLRCIWPRSSTTLKMWRSSPQPHASWPRFWSAVEAFPSAREAGRGQVDDTAGAWCPWINFGCSLTPSRVPILPIVWRLDFEL
jgi:hypothetical protein